MWRLTMFLLCLIAALSGTPLRQAEAADDFARSFGESGQDDVLGSVDGGVGDDVEESIRNDGGDTHSLRATIVLPTSVVHFASLSSGSFCAKFDDRGLPDCLGWLEARFVPQLAWLQCFLF